MQPEQLLQPLPETRLPHRLFWQLASKAPAMPPIQGQDDIEQCIKSILLTPKGSDVLRPDFGSDLYQVLDKPINVATPHIVRIIYEDVARYEPRCKVLSATPSFDESHVTVSIQWAFADDADNTPQTLQVPLK